MKTGGFEGGGESTGFLVDPYGRRLNNLRVSVTQRCNFNCFFCHSEGEVSKGSEMTPGEIEAIVETACGLGMRRIKVTGGEPLLRDDIVEVVSRIAEHADEVSMTTNGLLLGDKASALRGAGLRRVNVSLHSINPQTFRFITGVEGLGRVEAGVRAALMSDLRPVKINMVVLRGLNDLDIPAMIDFTAEIGAILQLIEFQPVQDDNLSPWQRYHSDLGRVEGWLEDNAFRTEERSMHRRVKYFLERKGDVVCVEVVKPMHNSLFCRHCTRLRVTSDGKLKPCLLRNDNLVDAAPYARSVPDSEGLERAFRRAVQLREPYWKPEDRSVLRAPSTTRD